jgi:hypothetical protein
MTSHDFFSSQQTIGFINHLKHQGSSLGASNHLTGMALTPLSSSIGRGLNPQPSDCEPSTLPLGHVVTLYHERHKIHDPLFTD